MKTRLTFARIGRRSALLAILLGCAGGVTTAACGVDAARPQTEADQPEPGVIGLASFYARGLHGRKTASGVPFDANALVAAHPVHPFGTMLLVTNLENGKSVEVEVVDRGPARRVRREGVIVDLSPAAARLLGFVSDGRARVRVVRLSKDAEG